jgi:hypothetical protein
MRIIHLEKDEKTRVTFKNLKEAIITKSGWVYDPRNQAMSGYPTIEKEVENVLITISYGADDIDLPFEVNIEDEFNQEIKKFASIEGVKRYIYKYYRLVLSNKDFFTLIGDK